MLATQYRADAMRWLETPRMRWRIIGFGPYVGRLSLSIVMFAAAFGSFILLYGLRAKPAWWYQQRWTNVCFIAAVGATGRFLLELMPAIVWLNRDKLVRRGAVWQSEWPLEFCRAFRCTIHGRLLRLSFEVPAKAGGAGSKLIVIAAHVQDAEAIRSILESSGHPCGFCGGAAAGHSTEVEIGRGQSAVVPPRHYRLHGKPPTIDLTTGLLVIAGAIYLLWLALGGLMRRRHPVPLWIIGLTVAAAIVLFPIGVLLVKRSGRPK